MAISNDILSSTLRILKDKEVDNLHRTTPVISALEKNGGIETVDGGQRYEHPVILTEHSSMTQLSTGYEPVSLSVTDPLRLAKFDWCDFVAPIVVTRKEELSNKGPRAIIKIAEARFKSVMGMLRREVEKQLIAGTSTRLTDLQTFNGFDAATGWFEELAFGTQANTVGELSKAAYPVSWQNQVGDVAGAFATNGLDKMADVMIEAQTYAPEGDISMVLASPASYRLYKKELQQQERYFSATEQKLDGGKLALAYDGATMLIEPNLGFTASAGTKVSMYFLNPGLLKLVYDKDAKFEMGDFEHVSGYASRAANIVVRMQLVCSHLAGHGAIVNAEA